MKPIHSNHSVSANQYHVVWNPKYRLPLLVGQVETKLKEIIYTLADEMKWIVQSLEVVPDHVHMLISFEPKWSVSEVMKYIKGRSSFLLRKEFPELVAAVRKGLWTSAYFVGTVGGANEEKVKNYIENQKEGWGVDGSSHYTQLKQGESMTGRTLEQVK